MAKFRGVIKACLVCGKEFRVPPSRKESAKYCSTTCADPHRHDGKVRQTEEVSCKACGKKFIAHKCHIKRGESRFCSRSCGDRYRGKAIAEKYSGENSSQWKFGITHHSDGYIYEQSPSHPYAGRTKYILQHRLVMEKWLRENQPDSPFLIKLGDNLYLSPDYVVHHKNGVRDDNSIDNLQIMTNADHVRHHRVINP